MAARHTLGVVLEEGVLVSNLLLNLSLFPATHGSGVRLVNMAAMVTKLELINGEGEILTLTPQDNKDLFNAAQVCMLLILLMCLE